MKKQTIFICSVLRSFCSYWEAAGTAGRSSPWANGTGRPYLTVDGVRYRKDETLVSVGDGLHRWRYEQSVTEQIASVKERGGQETYLVFANGTERRLLYGREDGFSFGPLSYEVWFREELLDELSGPLTEEKVSCGPLTDAQLTQLLACMRVPSRKTPSPMRTPRRRPGRWNWKATGCGAGWSCPTRRSRGDRLYRLLFQRPNGSSLSKVPGWGAPALSHRADRALALSPALPQILSVTEDDPRLKSLLDTLYPMSQTEGLSWDEFLYTFSADQSPEALEFRIDLYRPEEDSWPVQVSARLPPSPDRDPLTAVSDGQLRPVRKTPRTAWGFQNNCFQQEDECDEEQTRRSGRSGQRDQTKRPPLSTRRQVIPTLQRMIDRFLAGDWPFLLLETEQCRIIRTLDAPGGKCAVTIILKHHGQWKALTKAFPTELGVSMLLDCYEQGCLHRVLTGGMMRPLIFKNRTGCVEQRGGGITRCWLSGSQRIGKQRI